MNTKVKKQTMILKIRFKKTLHITHHWLKKNLEEFKLSLEVENLARELSTKLGSLVGARVYMTITDQNGNFVFADAVLDVHKDFIQNLYSGSFCVPQFKQYITTSPLSIQFCGADWWSRFFFRIFNVNYWFFGNFKRTPESDDPGWQRIIDNQTSPDYDYHGDKQKQKLEYYQ